MISVVHPAETAISGPRGRYLYAIVDGPEAAGPIGISGIDGAEVYALCDGQIAAVVSDLPDRKVRPERRKLAAHHEVMRRLMSERTVLPMAFGLIADGPESVHRILRLNHEAFAEQLDRLRDKVEMGLRVTWDVPNIFEYIVASHPDLAAYRDQIFRGGREPSHEEKIELGRSFDRLLNDSREAAIARVRAAIEPRCDDITVNRPRDERDVMNLACLVDRARIKNFEAGVVEAARGFNNDFSFDFNGPWPPHNFVDIELKLS